jgi:hypothetical protein
MREEQLSKTHKDWQFGKPKMATADEFNHPPWAKPPPKEVGGNVGGVISKGNLKNPQFMKAYKKESEG